VVARAEANWLVAGLGNPGQEYAATRHNVGFAVLDRLAAVAAVRFRPGAFQSQVAWMDTPEGRALLLKPQSFMNRSGQPVAAWLATLELSLNRLVVLHDDLDLPLGALRVVRGAGAGGHKGVASIQEALGSQAFLRIRVGIGRPPEGVEARDRVLAAFRPDELPAATDMVERAAAAVRTLLGEGPTAAMNRYNVRVARKHGSSADDQSRTPEQPEERR
jgi:PTH1 family peptidyl-tRNA hydrolase